MPLRPSYSAGQREAVRRGNIRLVLTLRCEDPCCRAEDHGDKKSNERCPAIDVSLQVLLVVDLTYPFAIMSRSVRASRENG